MPEPSRTSLSLLEGLRELDARQWARFTELYGPLVYQWCRKARVPQDEAADVCQEVFRAVASGVGGFRREQPADSFHGWLWGITRHKIQDHFRRLAERPVAEGGTSAHERLVRTPGDLPESRDGEDVRSDVRSLHERALGLIRAEFAEHTWRAFWKVAVEDVPPGDVAEQLGMTVGAVYNARYKVVRRLRQQFEGLL